MTFSERAENFVASFWAAIGAAVAGFVVYLMRKVFTSVSKVEKLEREIKAREEQRAKEEEMRKDDREMLLKFLGSADTRLDSIVEEQRVMREDIKKLFHVQNGSG